MSDTCTQNYQLKTALLTIFTTNTHGLLFLFEFSMTKILVYSTTTKIVSTIPRLSSSTTYIVASTIYSRTGHHGHCLFKKKKDKGAVYLYNTHQSGN